MRVANETLLQLDGQAVDNTLSTSKEYKPIFLGHVCNFSIQIVVSGTPNGYFMLQASNDAGRPNAMRESEQSADVKNWTSLVSTKLPMTAAGNGLLEVENCGYEWVRLVWIARGAGIAPTLNSARIKVKGV